MGPNAEADKQIYLFFYIFLFKESKCEIVCS